MGDPLKKFFWDTWGHMLGSVATQLTLKELLAHVIFLAVVKISAMSTTLFVVHIGPHHASSPCGLESHL